VHILVELVVCLKSIKEIVSILRSKPKPPVNEKAQRGGFFVSLKRKFPVKRFLAISPDFVAAHRRELSVASHLIAANIKKLKQGEVIESKGFVIKSTYTGKTHPGANSSLTLSVSFNGKVCFVKMGVHTGANNFEGFMRGKEFLESIGGEMNGFKIKLVPTHLFYSKSNSKKDSIKGFLVSDFFPSEKVMLASDIEFEMGNRPFAKTLLGKTISRIDHELCMKYGVSDAQAINCFVDKSNKTLYFFDLFVS
jgi:hypothetical protein